MTTKFFDVTLEENPKLGYYTVGDKKYYSKVQALIEGTRTDQFPRKRNYRVSIFGCVPPDQDVAVGQYVSNLTAVISTRIGR